MSEELVVNLSLVTVHDFLFFASQDYGATARPASVIGNYSLMYAMNRSLSGVRRLASGTRPHYEEDLPLMPVYATPASPVTRFPRPETARLASDHWSRRPVRIGDVRAGGWQDRRLVKITWNSTGESLLDKMAKDRANLPKKGAYYKHPPLTTFYFYAVGGPLPKVFRLGKKYTPVRAQYYPIAMKRREGEFEPTCPVNVIDLPPDTEILRGSILTVPPAPVLTTCRLRGVYYEGGDESGLVHRIPEPNIERFRSSWVWGA
ncbi:MAG: type I-D CRISPR-associated protein Cas5/Csc1 [Candidatus Thorarchaeota archaeon]